ncbi:MAG: dihydroorotase [Nitrososphaeria archaeon]
MGSILIRNGTVVINGSTAKADVLIVDGNIVGVGCCLARDGVREIDADGLLVLPGLIDEHVHLREPGLTSKEDFNTGTMAAAAGGLTLVLDMPNTLPPVDSAERLMEKRELVRPKSHVDFGLYGLVRDTTRVNDIGEMIKAGAIGFKVYMGPTTGNIPPPSHGTLYDIMGAISGSGVPLVVHAEDEGLVKRFSADSSNDPLSHLKSRPYICETFSVHELVSLSEFTGAHVHVAHVSSLRTLSIIRWARTNGIGLTGEVTPHHLFLDSSIYGKVGNLARINPPVRYREDSEALLDAASGGIISTVGSDHSPHTVDEKLSKSPPSGFPGLETEVPLMLNAVNGGRLQPYDVARLMSENVAKIFDIYPRYGTIMPGSRGNLTIVSLKQKTAVRAERFYSKAKYSPFDGMLLAGRIVYTVVGGELVYDDGEVHSDVKGEFLTRGSAENK